MSYSTHVATDVMPQTFVNSSVDSLTGMSCGVYDITSKPQATSE
ncbi:hypothetical protein [Bacillus sp. FJAT-27445]|nr:hypothetical protein [Bacillus sp. FJAT-27445]